LRYRNGRVIILIITYLLVVAVLNLKQSSFLWTVARRLSTPTDSRRDSLRSRCLLYVLTLYTDCSGDDGDLTSTLTEQRKTLI